MDDIPELLNKHCNCFDDDAIFFQRSFNRTKPKPQVLTKIGDESFFKCSKKVLPSWQPRESNGPEFFDPIYKASLCWYCYLNETDGEEGDLLKIRPMKLSFHLDDETFSLFEPQTRNSGHVQGRHFHRQKVPKNGMVGNDFMNWKDVQMGEDLKVFGRSYRIVACDEFTKSFLEDRGVSMKESEAMPTDAWSVFKHFQPQKLYRNDEMRTLIDKSRTDDLMPSWDVVPPVLNYHLAWLDSKNDFHGKKFKRTFKMTAITEDDTVTMIETSPGFNNQTFLRGVRLTYLAKDRVTRHYRVANLKPGTWIDVFKRPMYIYDCDGEQTKSYVKQQFGQVSYGDCPIEILQQGPPVEQFEILPSEIIFKARNAEFPGVIFLIFYYMNTRKIDVFEQSRLREWSKGRTFLLDIDAHHLSLDALNKNKLLRLFKWDFQLTEPNEKTALFLKQAEPDLEDSSFNLRKDSFDS